MFFPQSEAARPAGQEIIIKSPDAGSALDAIQKILWDEPPWIKRWRYEFPVRTS